MVASSCGVRTMCQVKCYTYTTSLDLLIIYEGALSVTVYQGPNRGWRAVICSLAVQHPFTLSDFHLRTHFLPEGLEWRAPFSSAVGCPRSQMSLTGMWVQCQESQRFGCQGHLPTRPCLSAWHCSLASGPMKLCQCLSLHATHPQPLTSWNCFPSTLFVCFSCQNIFSSTQKNLWLSQA